MTKRSWRHEKEMSTVVSFGAVLEAVDQLPTDDQEMLLEVLHRRMIERRREALAADIRKARKEFKNGRCRPATPDELMAEILS